MDVIKANNFFILLRNKPEVRSPKTEDGSQKPENRIFCSVLIIFLLTNRQKPSKFTGAENNSYLEQIKKGKSEEQEVCIKKNRSLIKGTVLSGTAIFNRIKCDAVKNRISLLQKRKRFFDGCFKAGNIFTAGSGIKRLATATALDFLTGFANNLPRVQAFIGHNIFRNHYG